MTDFNEQRKSRKVHEGNYWRYKKKTPPVDEFAAMNGPVKVVKPSYNKNDGEPQEKSKLQKS